MNTPATPGNQPPQPISQTLGDGRQAFHLPQPTPKERRPGDPPPTDPYARPVNNRVAGQDTVHPNYPTQAFQQQSQESHMRPQDPLARDFDQNTYQPAPQPVQQPQQHAQDLVTHNQLTAAVNMFQQSYHQWMALSPETSPELFQVPGSEGERCVSNELLESAGHLIRFCNHPRFTPECWELVMAIDQWSQAVFDWSALIRTNQADVSGRQIWRMWGFVVKAMQPRNYKMPEAISELLTMNPPVPMPQICIMYGFTDENGDPELWKLEQERMQPGTWYNKNWVHPELKRHHQKIKMEWAKRQVFENPDDQIANTASNDTYREPLDKSKWVEPEPAGESIDALMRLPGMTTTQVAKMKGITEDDVLDYMNNRGIVNVQTAVGAQEAQQIHQNPNAAQADMDRMLVARAQQIQTHPELSMVHEVIELASQGYPCVDIYNAIKTHRQVEYDTVLGIFHDREYLTKQAIEQTRRDLEEQRAAQSKARKANQKKATEAVARKKSTDGKPSDSQESFTSDSIKKMKVVDLRAALRGKGHTVRKAWNKAKLIEVATEKLT